MPIEIFIGETQPVRMLGKFVAFSKRINSVLVPEPFLNWANSHYDSERPRNLLLSGMMEILNGPPISLSELREMQTENPLKSSFLKLLNQKKKSVGAI